MISRSTNSMAMCNRQSSTLAASQFGWNFAPQFLSYSLDDTMRHMELVGRKAELDICRPEVFEGYRESFIRLNQMALSMTNIDAPDGYALGFRPSDEFCLNIPLRGEGWVEGNAELMEVKPRQAILFAPGCAVRKHWLSPSEVLTVHIPTSLIFQNADQLDTVEIASMTVIDFEAMTSFFDLIRIICASAVDPASAMLHPLVACHLEKALLALLFQMLPTAVDEQSEVVASAAVPYYVRRAENHMRMNFRANLTLCDLAEAAGVSRRTLQYGFKHCHSVSPMAFLKQLRLKHARNKLFEVKRIRQVGEVALDVGYQNASHFASDYRATFGEAPSQTVMRRLVVN